MGLSADGYLVIDGHVDVAAEGDGFSFPVDAAIRGGLNAAVVPVRAGLIPRRRNPETGAAEHASTFDAITDAVAGSNGRAAIALSASEVRANAQRGVFSFILGFQNARPLPDLAAVEAWLDRGVSVFDFGFVGSNQWVESSRPYPYASVDVDFDGLSPLGEAAIELLNARGVVIDTAQVSARARDRILNRSSAPVIASHNGLKARVGDADRTIGDDEVRAIADSGGLVQIVAFDGYNSPRGDDPAVVSGIRELRERFGLPGYRGPSDYYALLDAETADWDESTFRDYFSEYHSRVRHGWPKTDVEQLIDSIDHVVSIVGIDHVGVASDFHHGGGVKNWLDFSQTGNLTAALRARYDEADTAKIWGENLLRVWEAVRDSASSVASVGQVAASRA